VGPATDNIFYDIDLFDDSGAYASTVYGFTSDHRATFIDPITIPAHTSKVMTVLGDTNIDLSGQDGQMAGLMVESIKADQPVSGPLPVMGTLQTANASLQIGTVTATLGATDPRTRRTRYINDTGITFSSVRITAGSQEDVRMNSVAWRQSGSATAADLANIHTVVDGVSYPAVIDGTFYRTTFPNSILLHKGDSKEIRVVGDLTGTGAKRTVEFDIDQGSDFDYTGLQYGFGIYMTPSDNTDVAGAHSAFITSDGTTGGVNMTPYFAGSIIDVSAGAFSGISK
jgi:hypothetical protein